MIPGYSEEDELVALQKYFRMRRDATLEALGECWMMDGLPQIRVAIALEPGEVCHHAGKAALCIFDGPVPTKSFDVWFANDLEHTVTTSGDMVITSKAVLLADRIQVRRYTWSDAIELVPCPDGFTLLGSHQHAHFVVPGDVAKVAAVALLSFHSTTR